jgi:hypothetical protein
MAMSFFQAIRQPDSWVSTLLVAGRVQLFSCTLVPGDGDGVVREIMRKSEMALSWFLGSAWSPLVWACHPESVALAWSDAGGRERSMLSSSVKAQGRAMLQNASHRQVLGLR